MPGTGRLSAATTPALFDRGRQLLRGHVHAGWSLIDQIIVSLANFLSLLLLARFMPPAQFGVFVLAHTGLLLVTSLQNSLLIQPHNILGAKLKDRKYFRFTGSLLLVQLCASLALGVVLAFAGFVLWRLVSPVAGMTVLALALAAPPWMAQEFVRRVHYTTSASRRAAINDLVSYGLQLGGVILLAWQVPPERLTAVTALGIFGASSFVAALFGAWQLRQQAQLGWGTHFLRRWRATVARVWGFGRWLLAQNVTTWLGANGHVWVVGALLGAETVGLYRAAIHLVNVINPLRLAAFAYLPSRASVIFMCDGHTGLRRWMQRVSWRLLLPLVPIVLVLTLFPEQILGLVYGDKFSGLGLGVILAVATLAQTIGFARYPMEVAMLASGAARSLFLINLLPIALLLTAGVALILVLGMVGIPLSMLLISVTLFVATGVAYRSVATPTYSAAAAQRG